MCLFVALLLVATELSAQQISEEVPRLNVVRADPFLIALGAAHVEYERAIGSSHFSIGVSTWLEYIDVQDGWVHINAIFYTEERMFEGLALGVTAGVHRSYSKDPTKLKYDSSPVMGGLMQYNWLFGDEQNVMLGVGLGVEAILKAVPSHSPLQRGNANLRVLIGAAF